MYIAILETCGSSGAAYALSSGATPPNEPAEHVTLHVQLDRVQHGGQLRNAGRLDEGMRLSVRPSSLLRMIFFSDRGKQARDCRLQAIAASP